MNNLVAILFLIGTYTWLIPPVNFTVKPPPGEAEPIVSILYVTPQGNDTYEGTQTNPLRTLGEAVTSIETLDLVLGNVRAATGLVSVDQFHNPVYWPDWLRACRRNGISGTPLDRQLLHGFYMIWPPEPLLEISA